jgi:5-oxoprolinase (ATP-hydrolysing)
MARDLDLHDPIQLEILWRRLVNIAEEAWVALWRTSFSTIMAEAQDFGCEIMDAGGSSLAHSPKSMPVFNLTLPMAVTGLLERYPVETLEQGDVLITNDPWLCAGHLYDVAVVTPVFREGRCVALAGSIGHVSDIGGTKERLTTREVYEEGIQIPPLKLYRRGRINEDLVDVIKANVRRSDMVMGDLHALVSSNAVAARRIEAFLEEYEMASLTPLAAAIQDQSEVAMRAAVSALKDGTYKYRLIADGIGEALALPVQVTVRGDEIHVDYEGAPAQLAQGAINCTYSFTAAETVYALKSLLMPDVPANAGCYKPFTISAPEGSVLNCTYPAPVGVRHVLGYYVSPLVIGALAPAMPSAVRAATGFPTNLSVYGREVGGHVYNDHAMNGGGGGAWRGHDGVSAMLFPTSAATVSIEMMEVRTPVVVEAKELVQDSGGAGEFRGGLGQRLRVRKLRPDGLRTLVAVQPEGRFHAAPGLFGGRPGGRCRVVHLDANGEPKPIPQSGAVPLFDPREEVVIELTGGAGFGDPRARQAARIARDVDDGYVSLASAERDYGYRPTGEDEATDASAAAVPAGR